jgi:3-oxosteroid 1-dehydrogenase
MMVKQVGVPEKWDMELDLVCVGSSSGGLVAAIVGHDLGLGTVVLEKADVLGGATAISGGVIWIPFNHHMLEMGLADSREEALTYVRGLSLGRHDEENLAAYLDNGPEMIRYMEEHTSLRGSTSISVMDLMQPWHRPALRWLGGFSF